MFGINGRSRWIFALGLGARNSAADSIAVTHNELPDCCHMVAGVSAGFFMTGHYPSDSYMSGLGSHHFAHSTATIADDHNRWRLVVFAAILKKWGNLRFRHGSLCARFRHYFPTVCAWLPKLSFDAIDMCSWTLLFHLSFSLLSDFYGNSITFDTTTIHIDSTIIIVTQKPKSFDYITLLYQLLNRSIWSVVWSYPKKHL